MPYFQNRHLHLPSTPGQHKQMHTHAHQGKFSLATETSRTWKVIYYLQASNEKKYNPLAFLMPQWCIHTHIRAGEFWINVRQVLPLPFFFPCYCVSDLHYCVMNPNNPTYILSQEETSRHAKHCTLTSCAAASQTAVTIIKLSDFPSHLTLSLSRISSYCSG